MDRTSANQDDRYDRSSAKGNVNNNGGSSSASSAHSSNFTHAPTGSTIADPSSVAEADGRLYNGYREGKYLIPNDGAEQDRLDLQHQLFLTVLDGKLATAPVPSDQPIHVLDIGTGTGIWAIQFAETYPLSSVSGTDLSLIQPLNLPPNCQFFREDSEEEPWLFEQPFDYIHLRGMCTCFHDAKRMVERVSENLSPGGYVEYQEGCMEVIGADEASQRILDTSSATYRSFLERITAGAAKLGRDTTVARKYKEWVLEAGFVDVVECELLVPLNPWPLDPKDRKCGWLMKEDLLDTTRSGRKMIVLSGIPEDEVDEWLDRVRDSICDLNLHAYMVWLVVYGRKPFEYEQTVYPSPTNPV